MVLLESWQMLATSCRLVITDVAALKCSMPVSWNLSNESARLDKLVASWICRIQNTC